MSKHPKEIPGAVSGHRETQSKLSETGRKWTCRECGKEGVTPTRFGPLPKVCVECKKELGLGDGRKVKPEADVPIADVDRVRRTSEAITARVTFRANAEALRKPFMKALAEAHPEPIASGQPIPFELAERKLDVLDEVEDFRSRCLALIARLRSERAGAVKIVEGCDRAMKELGVSLEPENLADDGGG